MVPFSPCQAAVADGSSATRTPTFFTPEGYLSLKKTRPFLPTGLEGERAGEVGVLVVLDRHCHGDVGHLRVLGEYRTR